MKKRRVVAFDLETIADRSMIEFLPEIKGACDLLDDNQLKTAIAEAQANVQARKNIKDPVKIEADLKSKRAKAKTEIIAEQQKLRKEVAEKQTKQIEEMGLNPHYNLICCFAWCDGESSGHVLLSEEIAAAKAEADLLREAWELLNKYDHFVTFNGIAFDLPILNLHSLFRRVRPPVHISTRKYFVENHTDLRAVLGNWEKFAPGKMDYYMKRLFGYGKPNEIDGSKVQHFWDVGMYDVVGEYGQKDAEDTWRFYESARGFHPLIN